MKTKDIVFVFALMILAAIFIKNCGTCNVSNNEDSSKNLRSEIKNLKRSIVQLNKNRQMLTIAIKQKEKERAKSDTVYITRVKRIIEIAPNECDTFINLIVNECDTIVKKRDTEIALKDSLIKQDSTLIKTQSDLISTQSNSIDEKDKKIKSHKKEKALLIGISTIFAILFLFSAAN